MLGVAGGDTVSFNLAWMRFAARLSVFSACPTTHRNGLISTCLLPNQEINT